MESFNSITTIGVCSVYQTLESTWCSSAWVKSVDFCNHYWMIVDGVADDYVDLFKFAQSHWLRIVLELMWG